MTFIVENPLRQNRMLNAQQAFEAGFADALLEPVEFLDESLALLAREDRGGRGQARARPPTSPTSAEVVPQGARARSTARCTAPRPRRTARST